MEGRSFALHTVLIQYTESETAPVAPIGFKGREDHSATRLVSHVTTSVCMMVNKGAMTCVFLLLALCSPARDEAVPGNH